MKVIFKGETTIFLTKSNKYKVISECDDHYLILDNYNIKTFVVKTRLEVFETNNERNAGRKKIENGVIVRVTVSKELVKEFKQLVKDWRNKS